MTNVLELRGITKSFPGVLANDHIDLNLGNPRQDVFDGVLQGHDVDVHRIQFREQRIQRRRFAGTRGAG